MSIVIDSSGSSDVAGRGSRRSDRAPTPRSPESGPARASRAGRRRPPAAEEAQPIGLVREGAAGGRAVRRHEVEHPGRRLAARTRAPRAEDGALVGDDLGLDEEVAERRVQRVGGRGGAAPPPRSSSPRSSVASGRSWSGAAGAARRRPRATPRSRCSSRSGVVRLRNSARASENTVSNRSAGCSGRLVRRGPERAGRHVPEVAERPPVVRGRVLAPAGDGEVLPSAVAAARVGDHDVVPAVRQQLHVRRRRVGPAERAHRDLGALRRRPARPTRAWPAGRTRSRAGSAPGAAARSPGTPGRTRSASASGRRGAPAPATGASCPGGAPCRSARRRASGRAAGAPACSRSPRRSRAPPRSPLPRAAAGSRTPPRATPSARAPTRTARRRGRPPGRA